MTERQTERQNLFTLIELLVVIGILTVLLAIVLIAINPSRQFSQANNTQRRSDVNAILNAIHQFGADNNGNLDLLNSSNGLPSSATTIGDDGPTTEIDICANLVPTYLAELPVDPTATGASYTDCTTYNTGYQVLITNSGNRVTISAPSAELSETISVTR